MFSDHQSGRNSTSRGSKSQIINVSWSFQRSLLSETRTKWKCCFNLHRELPAEIKSSLDVATIHTYTHTFTFLATWRMLSKDFPHLIKISLRFSYELDVIYFIIHRLTTWCVFPRHLRCTVFTLSLSCRHESSWKVVQKRDELISL